MGGNGLERAVDERHDALLMSSGEGDFAEVFVGRGTEFGCEVVGGHSVARRGVRVGKGEGLALDVLEALVRTVGAHGDHGVVAEIAFTIQGYRHRSDVLTHDLAGQGVGGRTDRGDLDVAGAHGFDHGRIVRAADHLHRDTQFAAEIVRIGLIAGNGIGLVLARGNADSQFRILFAPVLAEGRGNQGERNQRGHEATARQGKHGCAPLGFRAASSAPSPSVVFRPGLPCRWQQWSRSGSRPLLFLGRHHRSAG